MRISLLHLSPVPAALQALEEGGVLRVHRHDLRAVAPPPADITSSPAHTRVSLLARAMRLPSRMAARVGRSPTIPTTAVSTVSALGQGGGLQQPAPSRRPPGRPCPPAGPADQRRRPPPSARPAPAGTVGPAPPAARRSGWQSAPPHAMPQAAITSSDLPPDGAGGAQY